MVRTDINGFFDPPHLHHYYKLLFSDYFSLISTFNFIYRNRIWCIIQGASIPLAHNGFYLDTQLPIIYCRQYIINIFYRSMYGASKYNRKHC